MKNESNGPNKENGDNFENTKSTDKNEELERFARELQEQILEQARARYSEAVIDHWQNPRNFKRIENPDGYAKVKGSCGDTMEMFLKVKGGQVTGCGFQTDGCASSIVCGSVATELAGGRSIAQALAAVSADAIFNELGGLPEADVHCTQLAAETMRLALSDCLSKKQSPWKKYYRKT